MTRIWPKRRSGLNLFFPKKVVRPVPPPRPCMYASVIRNEEQNKSKIEIPNLNKTSKRETSEIDKT